MHSKHRWRKVSIHFLPYSLLNFVETLHAWPHQRIHIWPGDSGAGEPEIRRSIGSTSSRAVLSRSTAGNDFVHDKIFIPTIVTMSVMLVIILYCFYKLWTFRMERLNLERDWNTPWPGPAPRRSLEDNSRPFISSYSKPDSKVQRKPAPAYTSTPPGSSSGRQMMMATTPLTSSPPNLPHETQPTTSTQNFNPYIKPDLTAVSIRNPGPTYQSWLPGSPRTDSTEFSFGSAGNKAGVGAKPSRIPTPPLPIPSRIPSPPLPNPFPPPQVRSTYDDAYGGIESKERPETQEPQRYPDTKVSGTSSGVTEKEPAP